MSFQLIIDTYCGKKACYFNLKVLYFCIRLEVDFNVLLLFKTDDVDTLMVLAYSIKLKKLSRWIGYFLS